MSFDKLKKKNIYIYIYTQEATINYGLPIKHICNLSYMMYLNYVIDLNILVYTSKQCMHK